MVTCNSAVTMDQTANGRVAKAKEGTATGNERITKAQEWAVSAKGKERTAKDKLPGHFTTTFIKQYL